MIPGNATSKTLSEALVAHAPSAVITVVYLGLAAVLLPIIVLYLCADVALLL